MGLNRMMMKNGEVKGEDGRKDWSYEEANNKTIAFTVPIGVKRIKVLADVEPVFTPDDYSHFHHCTGRVYACIENTINNKKWGEGISECGQLDNIHHENINSIVGVTPNKTYTLHFDCYHTSGVTFLWGKAINDMTPTVEDY